MRLTEALKMRWLFHRERKKRYQMVTEVLKKAFIENKGWDLALKLSKHPKGDLNSEDRKLNRYFKKFVECLNQERKNTRKQHIAISLLLRKMMQLLEGEQSLEGWKGEVKALLLELCLTKYHHTHFFSFGQDLLENLFTALTFSKKPMDLKEHISNYSFLDEADLIEKSKPLIFLERDFRQVDEFFLKRHFDSHQYNVPFLLYTLALFRQGQLVKVKMVRMGSPTKESWIQKPEVVDEFRGFLMKLKTKNQNHLYINKQKTWGEEGRRSQKIKELENQFDNFSCVCLPSDGDFYYQEARFRNLSQASQFKSVFYRMLLEKINSGYYHLPKKWKEDTVFCEQLQSKLEEVHKLYFLNKEELDFEERRLFIDLAYTHLILLFLQYAPVDSVNITCRDGIDRAGCEQSKLLYYFHLSLGIEEEDEAYKEMQFIQHFPVYLAKSRPIVPERRAFLYKVFESFTPRVKDQIKEKHSKVPVLHARPHFVGRKKKTALEDLSE